MKSKILTLTLAVAIGVLGALQPASAQVDRSKAPEAGPAPEIELGDAESFTLANGLKVFVIENHKLPRVSYRLLVDYDPVVEGEKAGYIEMMGSLMRAGTKTRTKAEIDQQVDFIGANLNTSSFGISASSLTKHQDKLLELMSDVLLNPVFPAEELEKNRTQTLSGLAQSKNSADAMASSAGSALKYGQSHPYGEPMTEETVKNITIEDCKAFYSKFFRPNISYLVVVGDVKLEEEKKRVEKYFSSWKTGDVPTMNYRTPQAPAGTRVAFVNKPGAVQSTINVTYPIDFEPGSKDAIAAQLMNNILGGGVFSGRLMQNLREDKAYTYGARSSISSDELVGSFNAFASVRNEVTDSAVEQFLYEMNRIITEDVTEDEFSLAKNQMNGSFARSLESPQTIARFALNIERYGLPEDYYANYLKRLDALTIEDMRRVAKKYIKPDNAIILVVGNKDEVAEKLSRFAASGKVEYFDMYGNVVKEEMRPVPKGVSAQLVLNNYVKAVTGMEPGKKLEKKIKKGLKDVTIVMEASMQGQTIEFVTKRKTPNMMKMQVSVGGMPVQTTYFDGEKGGSGGMMSGGVKPLEGDELEETKLEAMIFAERKYTELGYKTQLVGIEKINDADAYKMEITSPTGEKSTTYFDVATGLKVQSITTSDGGPMGPVTAIAHYGDYQDVGGFKWPHTVKQEAGPQTFEMKVVSVQLNQKLSKEDFGE